MKLERVGPTREPGPGDDPAKIPVLWRIDQITKDEISSLPDRLFDGIGDDVVNLEFPNKDLYKFETRRERLTFATGVLLAVDTMSEGDTLDYVCKWLQAQLVDKADDYNNTVSEEKEAAFKALSKGEKKRAIEVIGLIKEFVRG